MSYDSFGNIAAMSLETRKLASNRVRIPCPARGVATTVVRYKADHGVILHPDDYDELRAVAALFEDAANLEPLEVTELSERAHFEEDRVSEEPLRDREALSRLFE
jgi:hypothetical protein